MNDFRHFRSADGMATATFRVPRDNDYIATINDMIELMPLEFAALDRVPVRDLMSVPHYDIVGYTPDGETVAFNILSCEVAWLLETDHKWRFMKAGQS